MLVWAILLCIVGFCWITSTFLNGSSRALLTAVLGFMILGCAALAWRVSGWPYAIGALVFAFFVMPALFGVPALALARRLTGGNPNLEVLERRQSPEEERHREGMLVERALRKPSVQAALATFRSTHDDLRDFFDFFNRYGGIPTGPVREEAMLNSEILAYFLGNTQRTSVNGKLTRVGNDDVKSQIGLNISRWTRAGSINSAATTTVECLTCEQKNRLTLPLEGRIPVCGKCKAPLFATSLT